MTAAAVAVPPADDGVMHRDTANLDLLPDPIGLGEPGDYKWVCCGVVLMEVRPQIAGKVKAAMHLPVAEQSSASRRQNEAATTAATL